MCYGTQAALVSHGSTILLLLEHCNFTDLSESHAWLVCARTSKVQHSSDSTIAKYLVKADRKTSPVHLPNSSR